MIRYASSCASLLEGAGVDAAARIASSHRAVELFSISEEHYARLQAMHRAYFEQIRALVAQSGVTDRVVLVNLQLFSLAR